MNNETLITTAICYKCGSPLSFETGEKISRKEECASCRASMRCCLMCSFYDTTAYNECRELIAERVVEKDKANFCSYFKLGNASKKENKKEALVNAANSLFKK